MKLTIQMFPLLVLCVLLGKAHHSNLNQGSMVCHSFAKVNNTIAKKSIWFSDVYNEQDGLVVMEAENTTSDLGLWIKQTTVANYRGSGHIEFTGNSIFNGPPGSPLTYKFRINTAGEYRLILRAHKRLETDRDDLSNDCYVRMEGDYTESTQDKNAAALNFLQENQKLFGGKEDSWGTCESLHLSNGAYKSAVYNFKAGETYTLILSGRSKNFNLDRILFFNIDQYNMGQDIRQEVGNFAESSYIDGTSSGGGDTPNNGGTNTPAGLFAQVKARNMITPNGDGNNDIWRIDNVLAVDNHEVMVFNKAGQVVFKTTDYSIPWDGTQQGKPLPQGVYYYNLVLEHQGVKEKKSGFITLVR
ncbi:gliding motility-associated C-terminal domain-containing protein [uncultured Microscilla sp.]|uniref:gliding motility-associated C-terminal domain-containing protein n=1 Tax=uncultured Microscilla sp. TaxID=432653 RepID=UPI002627B577|nr:gliding motility-associated C-terminal domain-containing protein [uncultured Microscilla sp.]